MYFFFLGLERQSFHENKTRTSFITIATMIMMITRIMMVMMIMMIMVIMVILTIKLSRGLEPLPRERLSATELCFPSPASAPPVPEIAI